MFKCIIQSILVNVVAMINSYYIKSKHYSKISEGKDRVKVKKKKCLCAKVREIIHVNMEC